MNEPLIDIVRFNQACNRLEVLRGVADPPNKLMSRLLRKYPSVHIRLDDKRGVRLFDMGPTYE